MPPPPLDGGATTLESGREYSVDIVIAKLLDGRAQPGNPVILLDMEIQETVRRAQEIVQQQPVMLYLRAPVCLVGDIHGQFSDLLKLFDLAGYPPKQNYLFLGDYVDRGKQSLECICLLLAYKVKYPENMFLLRGNHECASINRIYGFYDECKRRYGVRMWKLFTEFFNWLPVAAVLERRIFCVHGGLSPELKSLAQIRDLERPQDIPDHGLLCDLMWSDPDPEIDGWDENDRGVSFTFGVDVCAKFLQSENLELIVRAHQVVEDGYELVGNRQLVTLFSAPNYCGEFDNVAAVMTVDEDLTCSFIVLAPGVRSVQ